MLLSESFREGVRYFATTPGVSVEVMDMYINISAGPWGHQAEMVRQFNKAWSPKTPPHHQH